MLSKKILIILLLAGLLSIQFISCNRQPQQNQSNQQQTTSSTKTGFTKSEMEFRDAMDRLGIDHVSWTRNFILNIMDVLAGTVDALKSLLKNQKDIGNAIKPYYGDAAGKQLTELLRTHIVQAGDILKDAEGGDKETIQKIK